MPSREMGDFDRPLQNRRMCPPIFLCQGWDQLPLLFMALRNPRAPLAVAGCSCRSHFGDQWEENGGHGQAPTAKQHPCLHSLPTGGSGRKGCFPQVLWAFTWPLRRSQTHIYQEQTPNGVGMSHYGVSKCVNMITS